MLLLFFAGLGDDDGGGGEDDIVATLVDSIDAFTTIVVIAPTRTIYAFRKH